VVCLQEAGNPPRGFRAGAIGVLARCALRARGIPRKDEAKDLLVLGPDQRTLVGIVEHNAHRAL
jgi:hypothetical protein